MLERIINLVDSGEYNSLGVIIYDSNGGELFECTFYNDEADIYYNSEYNTISVSMLNDDFVLQIPLPDDDSKILGDETDYFDFKVNGNQYCIGF